MLKQIGKEKLILIGVGLLALIVIIVLLITDQASPRNYHQDDYPVKVKSLKDGGMKITIDGSKSGDIPWEYDGMEGKPSESDSAEGGEADSPIEYKIDAKSNSKLSISIAPVKSGYETIKVEKIRRINEIEYPVASIFIDIVVATGEKGYVAKLAAVDERVSDGVLGAQNTDTPYYIKGNYVYLPNGGDWSLDIAGAEDQEDSWDNPAVTAGITDNGSNYYRVNYLEDGEQIDLVLENQELQQEIKLIAVLDDNGQIIIKKAAGK